MRIYGFHPSTDYKCIRRRSCIFLECIHCIFPLQSFTAKQFSLIIDQPRLLGWMLPLLSKFWHKWERLYWIIQRYTPFVIHTVLYMFYFCSIFIYFLPTYWRCKYSFILFFIIKNSFDTSAFFIDEIVIDTYEFSRRQFVYIYASVTFIQEKNVSVVTW